jgi:hypothetical protein
MKAALIFGFGLSLAGAAAAYIPDYHMIMSRTAENHGRGIYQIEQDVVFRGDPDPLVVHETWWVASEHTMRMKFEGRGSLKGLIQGSMIYDINQRHWREEGGNLKTARLTDDWVEPFFHFRFSKNIKPRLVAMKIAPPESLRERGVSVKDGTEFSYLPQNFIRLARTGGTVNYAIGTPTPPDDSSGQPGLWIEQDQFVVQKLRLPSQALIKSDQYTRFGENFWLPKVRTFSWGPNSVAVHVASVKGAGKLSGVNDLFKISSLDEKKNPAVIVRWPDQDVIREFYQRFR